MSLVFNARRVVAYSLTAVAATVLLAACAHQSQGGAAPAKAAALSALATQSSRVAPARALYELAYSPSQQAVYVASAGGFGEGAPPSRILRLDPTTLAVKGEISLPRRGFGLALDEAAGKLYVGHTVEGAVSVIDIKTNQVLSTLQLIEKTKDAQGRERYPLSFRQLVLDPAQNRLYMPGLSSDGSSLYVINTRSFTVEKVLPDFGSVATGITLDSAKRRLFVSNLRGELLTVDTNSLTVVKRYAAGGDQAINLAFDPATNRIFVVDQGLATITERAQKQDPNFKSQGPGNRILVLNADTGAVLKSVPTGDGPIAIRFDAPRKRIYVTNRGAGTVSAYDSNSYALLETVSLPTHPNSLAFDEKNNVLYASIKNGANDPKDGNESVARIVLTK